MSENHEHAAVIDYLKSGGLIDMLLKHALAPAVWICTCEDGSVRSTYIQPDHGVGGQPIPRRSSMEGKVFSSFANTEEVVEFLKGFGLSDAEASEVIKAVGTYP